MAIHVTRSERAPIKPQEFERLVHAIARDITLRWNPVIERWQVYQTQTQTLIQKDGDPRVKGIIMWTVEEENGDYREPMQIDLDRAQRTVDNYALMMKVGADKYADMLDKRDLARENHVNADAEDKLRQGAKEIANVLYKKQTHHGLNRARRRAK